MIVKPHGKGDQLNLDRQQRRILAIDDTPANLKVLSAALSLEFQVQIATSGAVGLAAAAKAPPDLILLDVMMPVMDGFEVCRRLKADPALQHIPVIFLTAMSAGSSECAGLTLGAADYIAKPINVEIARLRIGNLLEREGLRRALASERDKLKQSVSQLKETAQQLQEARLRELEIGNAIQRDLLQGDLPLGVEGVCLASLSQPSQIVDGDFAVIHRLQADCFDILVGDVMGKGVPAALIGAGIRATYHQVLADLLIHSSNRQALPTPAQMVNQLHQLLTPRLVELASFATLALYRFDLSLNTLTYVNAGHTPGLLLRAQQAIAMPLAGENLPVGVLPAEVYTQSEIPLSVGDRFLLFSDGITEARNAQGEEFGLPQLTALFESWPRDGFSPCTCQNRLDSASQTLQRFSNNAYVLDDQTLLLLELRAKHPQGD
jgi:serine phosphatase RsbU (regulator of sigma subunit)